MTSNPRDHESTLQMAKHKLVTWLQSVGTLWIVTLIDKQHKNQTQHTSETGR